MLNADVSNRSGLQDLVDPVCMIPDPVVVRPCGHVFPRSIVITLLAKDQLCPCDKRIESYEGIKILTRLHPSSSESSSSAEMPNEDSSVTDVRPKVVFDAADYERLFGITINDHTAGYIPKEPNSHELVMIPTMTLRDVL